MKDPFHPYFSNLERYDRFEEISSYVINSTYRSRCIHVPLLAKIWASGVKKLDRLGWSHSKEREDWKKNQEFSYRLAVSRILASVKFTYTQRDALQGRRKTEGEGATKLVCALSESESHVERAVCDYTS